MLAQFDCIYLTLSYSLLVCMKMFLLRLCNLDRITAFVEPSCFSKINDGFCRKHWGVMRDRSGVTQFFQPARGISLRWKIEKIYRVNVFIPLSLRQIRI